MKTSIQILIATLMLAVSNLWAQAPMVSDISYSQRLDQDGNRTKLVDIQYNLDGNRSMFVEFFFSHDGGVTFPVTCTAVTGDTGPFTETGIGKTAVWDAAQDWDQQFTSQGRIMIKATYGDQPTGFPGLGQDGNQSNGGPVAMETVAIPFPAVAGPKYGPSWGLREGYQNLVSVGNIPSFPQRFHVDKYEVTKGGWNHVAQWGRENGYSDLLDVSEIPDVNSADLGFEDFQNVVKWLNARSEMEGLEPVFYLELRERWEDINQDGQVDNGSDQLAVPQPPLFEDTDINRNGKWDIGEPFIDLDGDGDFTPAELDDLNGNGVRDMGLVTVCRVGTIIQPAPAGLPWSLSLHTKYSANGYRLPEGHAMSSNEFLYFAMGGRTEQGMLDPDPYGPGGVVYSPEWPWGGGEENPSANHAVVLPNAENPNILVGTKAPNGFGLYDMIGNTAELGLGVVSSGGALFVPSVGGSALQAPMVDSMGTGTTMGGNGGPSLWLSANELAPTGFRSIRVEF